MYNFLSLFILAFFLIGCIDKEPPKIETVNMDIYITDIYLLRGHTNIKYFVVGSPKSFVAYGNIECFPNLALNTKYTVQMYVVNGYIKPSSDLCRIAAEIKIASENKK